MSKQNYIDTGRGVWSMDHIPGIQRLALTDQHQYARVGGDLEPLSHGVTFVPPEDVRAISCAARRVTGASGKGGSASSRAKIEGIVDELVGYAGLDVRELGRVKEALWKSHTDSNKQLVLEAAALTEKKERCVILGAGPCYDIPLLELAQMFEEVHLLDLNPASLLQAVDGIPDELVEKIRFQPVEMTHALPKVLYTIKQEIAKAGTRSQRAVNKAVAALNKQSVGIGELAHVEGDLIISDMILSQLPTSLWIVDDWYTAQFQKSIADDATWMQAMVAFSEKIQSAHVEGLMSQKGAVVVLATDFGVATSAEEATLEAMDQAGRVTLATSTIHQILALQTSAAIEKTWVWHRDDAPAKFSPVWGVVFLSGG